MVVETEQVVYLLYHNDCCCLQIGAEVLSNLETQRETIGRARERLRETDADLGRSGKILSQMIRR
jgi:hypothetical protein